MMFDVIKCAARNIYRKKVRSFLTTMGVSIGVMSVIIIGNVAQCGNIVVSNELDSLGLNGLLITASDFETRNISLQKDDLITIKETNNIEQATPIMVQNADIYTNNGSQINSILWGIDSTANQVISLQLLYGRYINGFDIFSQNDVCMVDENFSRQVYNRDNIVGKKISILYNGGYQNYEVIGIIKTGSGLLQNFIGDYIPNFVYIPYTNMQTLVGRNSYDQIAVKVVKNTDVEKIGDSIVKKLSRTNGVSNCYHANNLSKQKQGLNRILNMVTIILSLVGSISLIVASLSIMTIMLVSVNERTREIGIKKSIGASRSTILSEFLTEALLLSLIGCVIGIFIGNIISFAGAYFLNIKIRFNWNITLLTISVSMITSIIFGVYPSLKASNLKPVDALRID